ncbi:hypothetical protein HY522_06370 [bacterium]|nr:hypothetical protein [bacterium]
MGRTLLATVFLSVTFLEIKLMAYTAATLVTAVTMATPWPRKFPLKLFLIGVGIGLLCLGYARTLGMSLPPLPFPGAFESIQSGRLAEHLAFHVFVLLGSFYLARLAVREIWIHRLERIEETMQTLNRYFSWKRVAALWTFGWREPLRSLMQRECMGLMRVHNVFVPWLISVGISAAFMVIGALDSWEFSRTRVLAILSPGLLVFGIYLAFFYVPMIFFLSISSFGSDRRDMELIAAQPLRPRDIILSKTWVYGFLLGCVCTVCMACFAWYNFPEGRISPGYFLGTIALWAAGFQVCWVSVSLGAILPSPSRLGKYTAAGIPAQGIAILVWALVPICLLIAWIAAEWLPARVYSLAPAMAAVWLLFGWLLHREATRAMEESGWARPREKIKIPTPRQAGF